LVQEVNIQDVYYDSTEKSTENPEEYYVLGKKDIWLRKRGDGWECKAPLMSEGLTHIGKTPRSYTPTYSELFGEKDIRRELNLQKPFDHVSTFEKDLQERSIIPYAKLSTQIKVYSIEPKVSLQIEESDFGYVMGILKIDVPNAHDDVVQGTVKKKVEEIVKKLDLEIDLNTRDIIGEYINKKKNIQNITKL